MLDNAFEQANVTIAESDFCVNYVWFELGAELRGRALSKEDGRIPVDDDKSTIPEQLRYIDKAIKNAKKYPNAQFCIWFDFADIPPETRFLIESYIYVESPGNIDIRHLDTLPDYRTISYVNILKTFIDDFKQIGLNHVSYDWIGSRQRWAANKEIMDGSYNPPYTKHELAFLFWGTVDTARILALREAFTLYPDKKYSIYADFDADDVKLDCPYAEKLLTDAGFMIGRTNGRGVITSGFLGASRDAGVAFINDVLLPLIIPAIEKGQNMHDIAIDDALTELLKKIGQKPVPSYLTVARNPEIRSRIPFDNTAAYNHYAIDG